MKFLAIAVGATFLMKVCSPAVAEEAVPELTITIDLSTVENSALRARALLQDLRERYNLARFEFTKAVRIAPYEIPHSHPVLTLNTLYVDREDNFLSTYLHEQIHWYLSDHREAELDQAIQALKLRYPEVPSAESEGARSEYSIYLHLVVNWLEIEATAQLIGRDEALRLFDDPVVYRWIYRTVVKDWGEIGALLKETGIAPLPDAQALRDP